MRKILSVVNSFPAQYKALLKTRFSPDASEKFITLLTQSHIPMDKLTQVLSFTLWGNPAAYPDHRQALLDVVLPKCIQQLNSEGDTTDLMILAKAALNPLVNPSRKKELNVRLISRVTTDLTTKKKIYPPVTLCALARLTRTPLLHDTVSASEIDAICDLLEGQLVVHLVRIDQDTHFNRKRTIDLTNTLSALTLIGQPKNLSKNKQIIQRLILKSLAASPLADRITMTWCGIVLDVLDPTDPIVAQLIQSAKNPVGKLPISVWEQLKAVETIVNPPTSKAIVNSIHPSSQNLENGTKTMTDLLSPIATTFQLTVKHRPEIAGQYICKLALCTTDSAQPILAIELTRPEHLRHNILCPKESFRHQMLKKHNAHYIRIPTSLLASEKDHPIIQGLIIGSLEGMGLI